MTGFRLPDKQVQTEQRVIQPMGILTRSFVHCYSLSLCYPACLAELLVINQQKCTNQA